MSIDSRQLRNALGRFATGVTLVTAVAEDGRAMGMTANSFSSVGINIALAFLRVSNCHAYGRAISLTGHTFFAGRQWKNFGRIKQPLWIKHVFDHHLRLKICCCELIKHQVTFFNAHSMFTS